MDVRDEEDSKTVLEYFDERKLVFIKEALKDLSEKLDVLEDIAVRSLIEVASISGVRKMKEH